MATFVLAHGAWSSAWAWRKMRPLMADRGHRFFTPTLTGLGQRAHLATPDVDLDDHVQDVIAAMEMEDLFDVVLLAHSYGGMVGTGVAARASERVARLIYLDAMAPDDGQSALDAAGPDAARVFEERVRHDGDGWRISPNPMPPDTSQEDLDWANPRRRPQPVETFRRKLDLGGKPLTAPVDYIYCTIPGPGDVFAQFRSKAVSRGWGVHDIEASHNPHITCPETLMALLDRIVG